MTNTMVSNADLTSGEALVARAIELIPLLSKHAEGNEAAGKIAPEAFERLRTAGLLHYWVPHCFGGGEATPSEAMQIIEAMSYADGSTGWAVMAQQVATGSAAAFLKPSTAKAVFGGNQLPVIAGAAAPVGRAHVADGGYRLTGHWSYGSGVLHADWVHTGGTVYVDGAPRLRTAKDGPDMRICILPATQVQLSGNWDVLGLRATGSVDYSINDVFVPEDFTHDISANEPYQGGDVYRLGTTGMAQIGHSAFAVGVAQRALDEIAFVAASDKRPTNLSAQQGGEAFQEKFAFATGQVRAARAMQSTYCEEVERALSKGEPLSTRQASFGMLTTNVVTEMAAQVVSFTYRYGGGNSLRSGVLQRLYRDISSATQHMVATPGRLREAGKELLGFYPGKVWKMGRLADPL